MNPFDLPGPQFLVFYAIVIAIVLGTVLLSRRLRADVRPVTVDRTDPYLLAYLRGGPREAFRVAAVSLIDRGLLEWQPGGKLAASADARDVVRRPIETAVVDHYRIPADPGSTFAFESPTGRVLAGYESQLRAAGLLIDQGSLRRQRLAAIGVLWAVAVLKIVVALGRGRTNIEFLVLMAVAATYLVARATRDSRTATGNAFLADLRGLFQGLRDRASNIRPGGGSNEMAFLAAVFGMGALPAEFATEAGAFGRTDRRQSTSGFWGWAWGSDGGGSDGGSCGGGGGGGCGGCGG